MADNRYKCLIIIKIKIWRREIFVTNAEYTVGICAWRIILKFLSTQKPLCSIKIANF